MKKTLLSTALFLGLSTTAFMSHAGADKPELYTIAIEVTDGGSMSSSTTINIDRNTILTVTEDGAKLLGQISSGNEEKYLASAYLARHWIYDFLPWEPEPEYFKGAVKYGDTYSIVEAENDKLKVSLSRVELLEIQKFTSGDITIEAPSTQDRTYSVTMPFPKNGDKSCQNHESQLQNNEQTQITICVSAINT